MSHAHDPITRLEVPCDILSYLDDDASGIAAE